MVEEFADRFEKAIKKGFISILILSILKKMPSHGYQIGKEIEERTYSIWVPPASTMYTILKQLSEQGLIKSKEGESDERGKKIYEITKKGREALNLMRRKHRKIRNIIHSFLISTLEEDDILILKDIPEISPHPPLKHPHPPLPGLPTPPPFGDPFAMIFNHTNNLSNDQKIQFLKNQRAHMLKHKEYISEHIKQVEKAIFKFETKEKEVKNKK